MLFANAAGSLAHAREELSLPAATLRTNRYSPRTEAA
jgi:hypothetical protein